MSDFLSIYGRYTQLKKSGNVWKGRCPFPDHHDSDPSFTVYPNGSYHCFGCIKNGSLEWFVKVMGGELPKTYTPPVVADKTRHEDNIPFDATEDDVWGWHEDLLDYAPARDYLLGRGIGTGAMTHHLLGWTGADARFTGVLSSFRNKVIIPYLTHTSQPYAAKLRSIDKKEFRKWGTGEPYGLWNALNWALHKRQVTFFVESELDAVLLRQMTVRLGTWCATIAAPAKQFTQRHIDSLLCLRGRYVMLPDNDAAGIANAEMMQRAMPALLVKWLPDEYKDIGQFFQLDAPRCEAWLARIIEKE